MIFWKSVESIPKMQWPTEVWDYLESLLWYHQISAGSHVIRATTAFSGKWPQSAVLNYFLLQSALIPGSARKHNEIDRFAQNAYFKWCDCPFWFIFPHLAACLLSLNSTMRLNSIIFIKAVSVLLDWKLKHVCHALEKNLPVLMGLTHNNEFCWYKSMYCI